MQSIYTNVFAHGEDLDADSRSFDNERDALVEVADWIDGFGRVHYLGTQVTEFDGFGQPRRCRWIDLRPDAEAYIAEGIAETRRHDREAAILRSQQL